MSEKFIAAIRAQEVAKELGKQRKNNLIDHNIKKSSPPLSNAQRLKILSLYKSKIKGTVIAKNMGLNASTVHNTIRRYDIKDGRVIKLYRGIYG